MSENRAKIDDFAPMRSLRSKISGTMGRLPPPGIIFARFVRQMNALQLGWPLCALLLFFLTLGRYVPEGV